MFLYPAGKVADKEVAVSSCRVLGRSDRRHSDGQLLVHPSVPIPKASLLSAPLQHGLNHVSHNPWLRCKHPRSGDVDFFGSNPSTAMASCVLGQVFGVPLDLCPVCVMGDGRVGCTDILTTILCVFSISVLLSLELSFRGHQIRLLGRGCVTCSANNLGNLDSDF